MMGTLVAACSVGVPAQAAEGSSTFLSGDGQREVVLAPGDSALLETDQRFVVEGKDRTMHINLAGRDGVVTAPTCVSARAEKGFVQVYNNCDTWQRVKVVMAFGLDKGCKA